MKQAEIKSLKNEMECLHLEKCTYYEILVDKRRQKLISVRKIDFIYIICSANKVDIDHNDNTLRGSR